MLESNATKKARILTHALKPQYPLDVVWLASQILDKPVVLDKWDFPPNICAMILEKPQYALTHICINRNRPRASWRFGVVHKLAHSYLGHQDGVSIIENEEDPILRIEADGFATEMLTPEHKMFLLAEEYREPMAVINQIQRGYEVSLEMTCRRLLELKIYDGVFAYLSVKGEPFFIYNTPGFEFKKEQFMLPKIKRGQIITSEETVDGIPIKRYIEHNSSGNYLFAYVARSPAFG